MRTLTFLVLFFCIADIALSQERPLLQQDVTGRINQVPADADINAAVKTKDFSFTINPYLWGVAMGGEITLPNTPSGSPATLEFNKSFSDAVSNLKFAFMVGGRVQYKQVGLLYDIVYANLKDFDATAPGTTGETTADVTFKELIADLALAYRINTGMKTVTLDAYAGARIWDEEMEATIEPPNQDKVFASGNKSWVDPIIGIQANFMLSKEWFSFVKTDFGGFGANSDWTYMLLGGFGYKFAPNWNTSLGLKYLGTDFEKEKFQFKVNQYGLALSIGYLY